MRLKKCLFYCTIFTFYSTVSLAQSVSARVFTITGEISGMQKGNLILRYFGEDGKYKSDTQFVKNGHFFFKGEIAYPVRASLTGNVKSRSVDDPNFTEFFIEPGYMNLKVTENKFKKFSLSGSSTQIEHNDLIYQKAILESNRKKIADELERIKDSI